MKKIPVDLKTSNPREVALVVLSHFRAHDTDASRLLHDLIRRGKIEGPDARLATELTLGVLRYRSRLDEVLSSMTHAPWSRTPPVLRDLLRLGAYQMLLMERIPAHAAVNETVQLARRWTSRNAASMVNAILRRLGNREPGEVLPTRPTAQKDWPHFYSHPAWFLRYLLAEYSPDKVEALLQWNNQPPKLMLRANLRRVTAEQLAKRLSNEGCEIGRVGFPVPESVEIVSGSGAVGSARWLGEGLATVQDGAAQLIGHFVAPQSGERIVDWCAAPGGKTTHLAELTDDTARIFAFDTNPARLSQVGDHAKRLGLKSIQSHDLRPDLFDWLRENPADVVLVDAPCTGLGTIQRHPDIRWRRKPSDPERSACLQVEILAAAAECVVSGGRLIYSTCTLGHTENESVIERFLAGHPNYSRADRSPETNPILAPFLNERGDLHTWPPEHKMDGFYAARLIRKR